jgi:2,4-diketo-3-deoxy-L-fuconate hydrolase
MKLLRYGPTEHERPGLLDGEGRIRDLSDHIADIAPDCLAPTSLARLARFEPRSLPLVDGNPRLAVPVVAAALFTIASTAPFIA